ncbi:MAG TPA: lipoprotein [Rhizomicrobium sp.]|nr:lipoprotein [Rhizomicrobium sp.]
MRLVGLSAFVFALAATLVLAGCGQKKEGTAKSYDLSAKANAEYLADNKAKDGVKVTADGLQYRVLKSGTGDAVTSGADQVTVTYKGWTIDGKVFDQTPPGETRTFAAGRLIPGWVEALRMMHEGDEWQLVIPANLAYGADGAGDAIGPNQTLVFDMTLISVSHEAPPTP